MAVGLTMIFGILKIVNFAHGEFYMVGAYTYTLIALTFGVSPWIALPAAAVAGAAIGWATERSLMRPLYSGYGSWQFMKDEYAVVVTFALSLLLINLAQQIFGPYSALGPALWGASRIAIGPFIVTGQQIVIVGLTIIVLAGLSALMKYSVWGRQIQAVAQNRFGASIAGINTARASNLVFTASGALAAFAGALLAPIINLDPSVGEFPAIKSYIIVVIGGMGSIRGSIVAALLLGVVESLGAVYISYAYRDAYGLILLILILVFRPQGLFGERAREV
ncbi:MAG: branched-chain amino acid ABC transporter permease [Candidimonas sp.]|nr:MAG: branched-chain amino acid ABC transporter permease [Candidimonas sp.]